MTQLGHGTLGRREALAVGATSLVGGIAGCSWQSSFPNADVVAGPDGQLVFEPEDLTVSVGETVTWGFPTSGHNVCCRSDDSDKVRLPDDAEPFASYDPGESPQGTVVPLGETYEHTFEVPGEYVYVCIPHVGQGMVGTVLVT
ncbi:plastocyanin/azurin family copper-binding protein [Natrinema halophilum]|uniref:plastocyanin/azurin family copper-binding protein n=1 Tax=Natrinema halophilum TaxID=1699371 RepID=UPI001C52BB27|nr:plastocyanin/azurin family copper-binding protein [Natrinema halophilum]QLG51070.2 plastocyanin/azurin family copper-binding protein [Natrinema halophilum]